MKAEVGNSSFPTTHWAQVASAAQPDVEARVSALESLLRRYLAPLLSHLTTKFAMTRDRAEDMVQGFVLNRVLLQQIVAKADRHRGRFRTFLLNALDNYTLNELRRERAHNPARAGTVLLNDAEEIGLLPTGDTFQFQFDCAWVREILAEVLARMRAQCRQSGYTRIWEVFDGRVIRPCLDTAEPISYDLLVERFEFDSPAQVYNALVTAKRMFQRILRSVVGEYVHGEQAVEEELADWKSLFARIGFIEQEWH